MIDVLLSALCEGFDDTIDGEEGYQDEAFNNDEYDVVNTEEIPSPVDDIDELRDSEKVRELAKVPVDKLDAAEKKLLQKYGLID